MQPDYSNQPKQLNQKIVGENRLQKIRKTAILLLNCAGSSIWLEHPPVTREVAGSSPVWRAIQSRRLPVFVLRARSRQTDLPMSGLEHRSDVRGIVPALT